MKVDLKLITILLSVVVLHVAFTEGWGVRVPNPVRVVRRVVRKAGQGIRTAVRKTGQGIRTAVRKTGQGIRTAVRKTGQGIRTAVRKTGQGIRTAVRKTGEGLKKAGEGIKKGAEVTGKHLYKGLRETGKAFITASSVVSDILDRVNLVKFVWKKLGACCVFYPSLCRAKREYETIQRRLKYYNKEIDKTWNKVESVYQWVIKINENVEDIGYHVERLTSGSKDTLESLLPSLIVQYNNKMNSIKQDVKWKNSSVLHLTRQGVTTFVKIEMAWQCPKVASSIKSGLKDLKSARDKCITIQRESNGLLRFFEAGWRKLKSTLSSQTLRKQLEDIKALCLDTRQSGCVSTIDKYLRQISNANYGETFGLQEEIINTLAAIKYTFSCLKRKQRVITTVSEHCQKGNDNFNKVYLEAVQSFFPNKDLCTGLADKDYTTKGVVLKQLQILASEKGFYSICELNNKEFITKTCLDYNIKGITYKLLPQENTKLLKDCKKIAPSQLGKIECSPTVCQNGGTCQEKVNDYACICPERFTGKNCEIDNGEWINLGTGCSFSKGNQFALFTYRGSSAFVSGFRLIHTRGKIGCYAGGRTNWGCNGHHRTNMYVTDVRNIVMYPSPVLVKPYQSGGWYHLPGYFENSPQLAFSDVGPRYIYSGQQMRVWYGEDLYEYTENDNHGFTCFKAEIFVN